MCLANPRRAEDRPNSSWIVLTLHDKAIRFTPFQDKDGSTTALDFVVYGVDDAAGPVLADGVALSDWRMSEPEMHGFLGWDGCINWRTEGELMMHGCGPSHAEQIAAVLTTVYHVGKRHMDLDGAEAPAMPTGAVEIIDGIGVPASPLLIEG